MNLPHSQPFPHPHPLPLRGHARSPRRRARRSTLGVSGALLALLTVLSLATPGAAWAHDELIGSDPEHGAVLDGIPERIELRFSAEPLDEPGATEVRVVDPTGAEVQEDDAEVTDNAVLQAIGGEPGVRGTYTVTWKVVSGDGHAISDEFEFSVGEASEPASTSPSESPQASDGLDATALWVIGGVVTAGLAGAVVALLVARSRRREEGR